MFRFKQSGLAFLGCLAAISALCVASAGAQEYPEREIHLIVGQSPGGGTDFISRLIGQNLAKTLGQPVIIENREGTDGSIAADHVARSQPDGYTLLTISGNHTIPPADYTPNYDPLKSFEAVTQYGYVPLSMVINNEVPINNVEELIEYAKANPGVLNFGDAGSGSTAYWAFSVLMNLTGTEMVSIPFSSGGAAMVAQLGNEIQLTFSPVSTALEQVKAGQLKALAVTGATRSPLLPEVPTLKEATGFSDFDHMYNFHGMLAPAGTPPEILHKLSEHIVAFINSDEFKKVMIERGYVGVGTTPEEFAQFLEEDVARYRDLKAAEAN